MSTSIPAPDNGFVVTNQEPLTRYDPQTGEVKYWRVHFTTPSGVSDWVTIDDDFYTAQNVAQAIRQRVAEIETIAGMNG